MSTTEEDILKVAKEVISKKGLDAFSLREIAIKVGCNKSMLHYYYRCKTGLVEKVMEAELKRFADELYEVIGKHALPLGTSECILRFEDLVSKNRNLLHTVLNELHRNPERIIRMVRHVENHPSVRRAHVYIRYYRRSTRIGFLINLLSLSTFPLIFEPTIQSIFFKNNSSEFSGFLDTRKLAISNMLSQQVPINIKHMLS